MTYVDPLTYIKAVLAMDFSGHSNTPESAAPQPLVITLSRDDGALGEAVAQGLALALGIPIYDQEILERVAKSAKKDKLRFQAYDDQSDGNLSAFLYSLISGNPTTMQDYRRHLCDVVLELAREDGIIVGRGAHLILAGKKVFRVRVVGSVKVCAQRIALEHNIPLAVAERRVAETNARRNRALIDMFGGNIAHCAQDHAENFDLIINTDRISADAAVDIILLALRKAGHIREVPE